MDVYLYIAKHIPDCYNELVLKHETVYITAATVDDSATALSV